MRVPENGGGDKKKVTAGEGEAATLFEKHEDEVRGAPTCGVLLMQLVEIGRVRLFACEPMLKT